MPEDKLANEVSRMWAAGMTERNTLTSSWETIAKYVMPRKSTFYEDAKFQNGTTVRRERMVLDSTAPRALELFASFLYTSLTNPSQRWFNLGLVTPGEVEARDTTKDVKQWLETSSDTMALASRSAYTALHEVYLDLGLFGTACMFIEWDSQRAELAFSPEHLADILIWENTRGMVDMVARRRYWSARQAYMRFDRNRLGKTFEDEVSKDQNRKFEFVQLVFPIDYEELAKLYPKGLREQQAGKGSKFLSVWICQDTKEVVAEGGFGTFPAVCPRWLKARGEVYGRSPSHTVIGDVIMVNRMAETVLRGAEKLVDPPLVIPDGGILSPLRLFPGGITYSDGMVEPKPLLPPGASRIELGSALIEQRQQSIREGYFTPLFFQGTDNPVKTATQVLQESDERNRQVAPMLLRMERELYDVMLARVIWLLQRNGQMPPVPPGMPKGAALDVRYISPTMASFDQTQALAAMRWLEGIFFMAQADPGVVDHVDLDEAAKFTHHASGTPANLLRSKAKVDKVREARAQQQEAAALQEQAAQAGDTAAKLISATSKRGS